MKEQEQNQDCTWRMYLTLECTTIRKFGLNKSGYLISIGKDEYFYWTDLKQTGKSPHTLLLGADCVYSIINSKKFC